MWSKPIIVQQSVGGDLAILLMDSQGVYDENTDLRDWSTIVGITLLTSSIFIYNVFTDIQENNLTDLESFLNYGQMAIENEQTDEQLKPFQKLVLLSSKIRSKISYSYLIHISFTAISCSRLEFRTRNKTRFEWW
jgi:atlastin